MKASVLRQIGAIIFHTRPSNVDVHNLDKNIWLIEKDGINVIGKLTKNGSKACFEIKEGDRELLGKKYIVYI